MPLSPTDQLRLLNLAYNQMQADFKRVFPDLFRGDMQTLTTDASGYVYLNANTFEIELVTTQDGEELDPIIKRNKNDVTGWYIDGAQTSGASAGKLRLAFRNAGAAWVGLVVKIDTLIEYPELATVDAIPYPFVQQRYLNMLTEMAAVMLYAEGGKESAEQMKRHLDMYNFLLENAKKDRMHQLPQYQGTPHSDAGDTLGGRFLRT